MDNPEQYCLQAEQAFEKASDRGGPLYSVRLAGLNIQLHFANGELVPYFTPALAHLKTEEPDEHDLVIHVWDSYSTGTTMPAFPWGTGAKVEGQTTYYEDRLLSVARRTGREQVSILHREKGRAYLWVPRRQSVEPVDGRPFRTILHWALDDAGISIVHAGAVGLGGDGVLVTGKSGSGKSTTIAACLRSPLSVAGDENVAVDARNPFRLFSLYNSVHLDARSRAMLPFLEHGRVDRSAGEQDKTLTYLYDYYPDKIVTELLLKAIVVAEISGAGPSLIKPVSAAAALTAMAPTSLFQGAGRRAESFRRMSQVVRDLPCFLLQLGNSPEDLPVLLKERIESIR